MLSQVGKVASWKMPSWQYVKLTICQVDKMSSGQNVKLTKRWGSQRKTSNYFSKFPTNSISKFWTNEIKLLLRYGKHLHPSLIFAGKPTRLFWKLESASRPVRLIRPARLVILAWHGRLGRPSRQSRLVKVIRPTRILRLTKLSKLAVLVRLIT